MKDRSTKADTINVKDFYLSKGICHYVKVVFKDSGKSSQMFNILRKIFKNYYNEADIVAVGKGKIIVKKDGADFLKIFLDGDNIEFYYTEDFKNVVDSILDILNIVKDGLIMFIKCRCKRSGVRVCFENIPKFMFDKFKILKYDKGCRDYDNVNIAIQDVVNIVFSAYLHGIYTLDGFKILRNINDVNSFIKRCCDNSKCGNSNYRSSSLCRGSSILDYF